MERDISSLLKFENVDCMHEVWQLFDARHGVKKRCQTWHRIINARITRCRMRHRFLTPCQKTESHVWRQKANKLHACNQRCPFSANGHVSVGEGAHSCPS